MHTYMHNWSVVVIVTYVSIDMVILQDCQQVLFVSSMHHNMNELQTKN